MRTAFRWILLPCALLAIAHADESWQYSASRLAANDTTSDAPVIFYRLFVSPALLYCTACVDAPHFSAGTWSATASFALPRFATTDIWNPDGAPAASAVASVRVGFLSENFLFAPKTLTFNSMPADLTQWPGERNRYLRFSLADQADIRLVDHLLLSSGYKLN